MLNRTDAVSAGVRAFAERLAAIESQIESAFPVQEPGELFANLGEYDVIGREQQEMLGGAMWRDLDDKTVLKVSWCELPSRAFRYYLPAALKAALRNPASEDLFMRNVPIAPVDISKPETFIKLYGDFNKDQLRAIAGFVLLFADLGVQEYMRASAMVWAKSAAVLSP